MGKLKFRTKMILLFVLIALMGMLSVSFSRAGMREIEVEAETALERFASVSVTEGASDTSSTALEEEIAVLNGIVTQQTMKVTGTIFFILFLVLIVGIAITYDIIHSLNKACKYTDTLSEGDLTGQMGEKYLDRNDSVGDLAVSLNRIKENMNELIGSIQNETAGLKKIVAETEGNVGTINGEIEGISAATQQLAAGMEEAAASAEEMNAMSAEIETVAKNIAVHAQDGAQRVAEIHDRAELAKKTTSSNRKHAKQVHHEIRDSLSEALKDAEVVSQIEVLADAIMEITSQTSLLSLNASIEAARAGEAGRGFAVVADEIRALADQSESTVTHIQEITESVTRAVKHLSEDASRLLSFVATDVSSSFDVFDELSENYSDDAEYVDGLVTDFSATSQELLASIDGILEAINGVSTAATEGATGTQDVAEKIQKIAMECQDVVETVKQAEMSANKLNSDVEQFKIAEA